MSIIKKYFVSYFKIHVCYAYLQYNKFITIRAPKLLMIQLKS